MLPAGVDVITVRVDDVLMVRQGEEEAGCCAGQTCRHLAYVRAAAAEGYSLIVAVLYSITTWPKEKD